MDATLRIGLLGRPAFEVGGKTLACSSQKAVWLVAYVLLTRERHSRSRLAALLWGGAGQRLELGSLRVALTKLPPSVAACLEIDRDTIGPAGAAPFELDVDAFVAACASESVDVLGQAVARYGGELLQGVPDDAAPEFSDWLLAERTRLRELAHGAHLRLAQRLHAQGDATGARAVADAWLRHDPASESMHRLLMNWLSHGGGDQALAHYEVYRRARAVAHGAAPSEEMAALAERLRQGREQQRTREQPARITAATTFFGRTDELARAARVAHRSRVPPAHAPRLGRRGQDAARGGARRSRGGDVSRRRARRGARRRCRIRVSSRRRSRALAACSPRAPPIRSTWSRVSCGERAALLVIDNLEHLLDEPDDDPRSVPAQVATLLRNTGARLKILATSREPLRLQEEWLYELDGLAHPRGSADGADAQGFAAVQFFAQRARQAYMGFSLAAELPNVVQICALLEGLPLGLELAASWVRKRPLRGDRRIARGARRTSCAASM